MSSNMDSSNQRRTSQYNTIQYNELSCHYFPPLKYEQNQCLD